MSDTGGEDDDARLENALIVRSKVEAVTAYGEYREVLRDDFYYSCGYCTLSECEAQGLTFEIDHYEPVALRPDLKNDYENLIYSCDECNSRKSDLTPPPAAREAGFEFFRPDKHSWEDHFKSDETRVNGASPVGEFSTEMLDLNRQQLRRLRDIRKRLHQCDEIVAGGILALRRFKIDQLPPSIKGSAFKLIRQMPGIAEEAMQQIDEVLKQASRSPLVDEDADKAARMATRAEHLAAAKALFPGVWRGRERKAAKVKS